MLLLLVLFVVVETASDSILAAMLTIISSGPSLRQGDPHKKTLQFFPSASSTDSSCRFVSPDTKPSSSLLSTVSTSELLMTLTLVEIRPTPPSSRLCVRETTASEQDGTHRPQHYSRLRRIRRDKELSIAYSNNHYGTNAANHNVMKSLLLSSPETSQA